MREVGSYEAKTHLSQLLDAVAAGEKVTITKHGVPVALLAPVGTVPESDRAQALEALRAFGRGRPMGADELRAMREEGRL